MGFPWEVLGTNKENITRVIHIKYVENMDLNYETNGFDEMLLKNRLLKTNCSETNFGCESYTILKNV